jgi:hypothetical protein
MGRRSAVTLGDGGILPWPSGLAAIVPPVLLVTSCSKGLGLVRALLLAAREERELYRDARAALRERQTLGCRSNAELEKLAE